MEAYEELEVIGTGAFGKVCKVRRRADNKVWSHLIFLPESKLDFSVEGIELWSDERAREATTRGRGLHCFSS
jgi:hypothetical protein